MENYNPEDSSDSVDSRYHRRIQRLEKIANTLSDKGIHGVLYSLIIDDLNIKPRNTLLYDQGVKKRYELCSNAIHKKQKEAYLVELANSYEEERQREKAPTQPLEKRSVSHKIGRRIHKRKLPYTIEQVRLDEEVKGYVLMKSPHLGDYNQALKFLEYFGITTLNVGEGEPFPLKRCKPSRVIAAAVKMVEAAERRPKELNEGLREIVNGIHSED